MRPRIIELKSGGGLADEISCRVVGAIDLGANDVGAIDGGTLDIAPESSGLAEETSCRGAGSVDGGRFSIVLKSGGGVRESLDVDSSLTGFAGPSTGGEPDLDPGAD